MDFWLASSSQLDKLQPMMAKDSSNIRVKHPYNILKLILQYNGDDTRSIYRSSFKKPLKSGKNIRDIHA
jgi:hypothetical protein